MRPIHAAQNTGCLRWEIAMAAQPKGQRDSNGRVRCQRHALACHQFFDIEQDQHAVPQ